LDRRGDTEKGTISIINFVTYWGFIKSFCRMGRLLIRPINTRRAIQGRAVSSRERGKKSNRKDGGQVEGLDDVTR